MKKVILSLAVIAMVGFTSCKNEKENRTEEQEEVVDMDATALNTTIFGVRGNCSMCKKTIEGAANDLVGVAKAEWDMGRKQISVVYDDTKTTDMEIQQAVARAGYDTERIAGDEAAYENLPDCCKYDRDMEMNLDTPKEGSEDNHHH